MEIIMWSALRNDLTEFVSTVTEDTSQVLSRIDRGFDTDENNNIRNNNNNTSANDDDDSDDDDGDGVEAANAADTSRVASSDNLSGMDEDDDDDEITPAAEEALRRMELTETFTAPLLLLEDEIGSHDQDPEYVEQVQDFLTGFQIEAKTDGIATLLEENADTLKPLFETLVPTTVTYSDFWQRFYFRCDADRIQMAWDKEEIRNQQARAQAVTLSLNTVRNFFGGAVKAVSATLSEDDQGEHISSTTATTTTTTATAAMATLFGTSGRPPFVMNTAVSEDDNEGEGDAEELGWDESDEEDDDDHHPTKNGTDKGENLDQHAEDDDDDDDDGHDDEIEFKDEAMEKLQEQYKQAIEERDQLQETVVMLRRELAALQSGDTDVAATIYKQQLHDVQIQLFEKTSELAALQHSIMDDSAMATITTKSDSNDASSDAVTQLQQEVERLHATLHQKEEQLAEMETMLKNTMEELSHLVAQSESTQQQQHVLDSDSSHWQAQLAALTEQVKTLQHENESLQQDLRASRNDNDSVDAVVQIQRLEQELSQMKVALQLKEEHASKLEEEMATMGCGGAGASHASPDTVSNSVVKIEHDDDDDGEDDHDGNRGVITPRTKPLLLPPTTTITAATVTGTTARGRSGGHNDDEEEDVGWGDDWGDEDNL